MAGLEEEEIMVLDLNAIDEDYDFFGNARTRKTRNVYKSGGHNRTR